MIEEPGRRVGVPIGIGILTDLLFDGVLEGLAGTADLAGLPLAIQIDLNIRDNYI